MPRLSATHRLLFAAVLCMTLHAAPVLGMVPDETLLLLEGVGAESVTASRAPKPLSQSGENITIVTVAEIEALHAHTLADVLVTVPGVQVESVRTPGSLSYLRLQGSSFSHVLVMLDGVPINNLADNFSDIGLIPARIIERIEIVKGAASSAWGQALGGVINVITKAPEETERAVGGSIGASYGERGTGDAGGELAVIHGDGGAYLSGGYLSSDGLLPNNHSQLSNAYAKLTHALPGKGQFMATMADMRGKRGDFAYAAWDVQEDSRPRMTLATLSLSQPLSKQLDLELGGRYAEKKYDLELKTLQNAAIITGIVMDESRAGLSARLVWRGTTHLLVAGMEYDDVQLRQSESVTQVDVLDRHENRWGAYLNDTISLGTVAISPGFRYDQTGKGGEQLSPSLGVTWQLSENNLLRAYTARGYSLPSIFLNTNAEKVWTSQVGFESSAIANLWLKGTLFRNETRNVFIMDTPPQYHLERQIKQGGELELRTSPWHNLSLSSGYTFLDARRTGDHAVVPDVPSQTLHLGMSYDDARYLRGVLTGRYIWWNAAAAHHGHYSPMVWDVHLSATPFGGKIESPEIFLSIMNLFNGSQYLDEAFRNAGRWVELGVRYQF